MKNRIITAFLLAGILPFLPCCTARQADVHVAVESKSESTVRMHLSAVIPGTSTKAEAQTPAEKQVNTLDVFIYLSDDLDVCYRHERFDADNGVVELPKGHEFAFFGVANMPAGLVSADVSAASLRAASVPFSANYTQGATGDAQLHMVMSAGPVVKRSDAACDVELEMVRLCSRVDIAGSVSFNLEGAYLPTLEHEILGAQMVSVSSTAGLWSGYGSAWLWNTAAEVPVDGTVPSGTPTVVRRSAPASAQSWSGQTFYAYPNNAAQAAGKDDLDNVTKLAVCARIGSFIYWYTIGIPGMERNTIYRVNSLTITREGAQDAFHYVPDKVSITFSVNVIDWGSGEITGSYNGETDPLTGGIVF